MRYHLVCFVRQYMFSDDAIEWIMWKQMWPLCRNHREHISCMPHCNAPYDSNMFLSLWHSPTVYLDGLVQDCSISSALAMKILKSCTKPSIKFDWNHGRWGMVLNRDALKSLNKILCYRNLGNLENPTLLKFKTTSVAMILKCRGQIIILQTCSEIPKFETQISRFSHIILLL